MDQPMFPKLALLDKCVWVLHGCFSLSYLFQAEKNLRIWGHSAVYLFHEEGITQSCWLKSTFP